MKRILFLLALLSLSFSYYYPYIVDANNHSVINLVYDDYSAQGWGPQNGSYSYADNSLENPDAELRLCADTAAELQEKWVAMAYADGINPGDYLEISHYPLQITSVPPTNCVYLPLDLSSFRAWYPSIPFVFISDSEDLSSPERVKLLPTNGWLAGNYTVVENRTGNTVNITVTEALDDGGSPIIPDVDYLVVGTLPDDTLETIDTAITSINDSVVLSLGGYTSGYVIHINGIGPGNFPPMVTILSPEETGYTINQIPFTYTIYSYYPLDSCWYLLDGQRTDMPDCTIPYILIVEDGTHTLELYANDSEGQVGSDSVTFRVGERPPSPPSGPGGPHIGIPPEEPVEPPPYVPPAYEHFSINPEDIDIIINYPLPGEANFTLYSTTALNDVECFIDADFAEYARVELESTEIPDNSTITGKIIVEMPPTEILDYDGDYEGRIQCVGKPENGPSLMLSTMANLYLTINKPWIEVEEETLGMMVGEQDFFTLNLTNVGNGTAYLYAPSLQAEGLQSSMFAIITTPSPIYHGESKEALLFVSVPSDYEPGTYYVPFRVYENERLVGEGVLKLIVGYEVEGPACQFPLFIHIFDFPDLFVPWAFLLLLFLANWKLIQWRENLNQSRKAIISAIPLLLALPGIWILEPCFMMNVALLQFLSFLYLWWKNENEKRKKQVSYPKKPPEQTQEESTAE
ncbi:hypothetical protein GF412_01875 [Candidatus Micrarchaeota archaeon]|nr:hypothetical protein [Candidatus Micrarchaeota archaeon]MBD3417710.1 hypothetical protein [Candidatus Micrarchaeota archaeon]